MHEGDLLWTPSPERRARANITGFTNWLAAGRQREFGSYEALWQWSVTDLDGFWGAVWDYCGVQASAPAGASAPCRARTGSRGPG